MRLPRFKLFNKKGKKFACTNCGNIADADVNAAHNIAAWGVAVNTPEKSTMYCSLHSLSGLKPIPSLFSVDG
jgi:transposase